MRKAATMPISVRATAVETSVTSKRSGSRLRVKYTAASAMTSITVRTRLMEEISLSLPLAIFFVTRAPIRPKSVPQTSPAATDHSVIMSSLLFFCVKYSTPLPR